MKKILSYSFFVLLFLVPKLIHAQVVITEIMYDLEGTDTSREWVEIQNTGSTAVDLSSWKFFEANTNHSLVPDGSGSIAAGSYAIIADNPGNFRTDQPNFTGIVFDSSFSLNNDPGEALALKNDTGTVIDQVTYTADPSGQYAGKSLQKNGSSWIVASPTPGATNATEGDTNASGEEANGTSGETSPPATPKKPVEVTIPKITAEIVAKTSVVVGVELEFEPHALGYSREFLSTGRFVWNLGDGTEIQNTDGKKIFHTYDYVGEYIVTLDYIRNPYLSVSDATDRIIVKVLPQQVEIVSFLPDGTVTLKNTSTAEVDLSGWSLWSGVQNFTFPKNTFLMTGATLIFSPKRTGFIPHSEGSQVSLHYPSSLQAAIYPATVAAPVSVATLSRKSSSSSKASSAVASVSNAASPLQDLSQAVEAPVLTASASNAIAEESAPHSRMWIFFLLGLIVFSVILVLSIRRRSYSVAESEELAPEDIEILEDNE